MFSQQKSTVTHEKYVQLRTDRNLRSGYAMLPTVSALCETTEFLLAKDRM